MARFLGHANVYEKERVQGLGLRDPLPDAPYVLLRSDLITLSRTPNRGDVSATLSRLESAGAAHTLLLELPTGLPLHWTGFTRELPAGLGPGDTVGVHIPPGAVLGLEAG